jgi:hypothetical protein
MNGKSYSDHQDQYLEPEECFRTCIDYYYLENANVFEWLETLKEQPKF